MPDAVPPPLRPTRASPTRPPPTEHTHDRHQPHPAHHPRPRVPPAPALRPSPLRTALRLAADPSRWRPHVDFDPDRRYYRRLVADEHHEAWLLTWLPGQGTDWHDHGGSGGAFVVLQGAARRGHRGARRRARHRGTSTAAGSAHAFGPDYVHRVTNEGPDPAVSLHVYAPRLEVQHDYVSRRRHPAPHRDRAGG